MFFESKGYQPIEPIHKSPEVNKLPPIFECYVNEAIKKGLGLPPSKEVFMTTSDYGAKCMLIGILEKNDITGLSFAFEPEEEQ